MSYRCGVSGSCVRWVTRYTCVSGSCVRRVTRSTCVTHTTHRQPPRQPSGHSLWFNWHVCTWRAGDTRVWCVLGGQVTITGAGNFKKIYGQRESPKLWYAHAHVTLAMPLSCYSCYAFVMLPLLRLCHSTLAKRLYALRMNGIGTNTRGCHARSCHPGISLTHVWPVGGSVDPIL